MKLLNYTSLRYLLFAALLLLFSIPVFYVVLNKIFTRAIDKDLYLQAEQIPNQIGVIKSERDLMLWKALDKDLEIVPADSISYRTKPYTLKKLSNGRKETFRILQKKLHILDRDYIVQIESSVLEKDELIRTILVIQLGLFLVLMCGAVGINYFINKKVWRPFYRNLSFLQHFDVEKESGEALSDTTISEFKQLNQSVTQLTTGMRRSFLSQKEFIENASHELQTPLAKLKFKLELLSQEKTASKNQHAMIGEMYKVIEQLDALNKNLLLLSRIDNGQYDTTHSLDVIGSVREIVDELSFIASSKSQQVVVEHSVDQCVIHSNKILFAVMVKNLLMNAIRFSANGTTIHLVVHKHSLQVINPGEPLAIKPDRIFDRFSRSDTQRGNGLGLAIVKAIASLHHYAIDYKYENRSHLFTVQWGTKSA